MDIIAAYREVGTLPGRRRDLRHDPQDREAGHRARTRPAGRAPARRAPRAATTTRSRDLVAEQVDKTAGPDQREAAAAGRAGGRLCRVGRNFRRLVADGEAGVARGQAPPWSAAGGVDAGRARWSSTGAMLGGGLHVFCAVLAWSRCAVRAVRRRRARRPRRWRCWPSASRRSAGCPKIVLADRMGCLKGGVVAERGGPDRRTTCGSPPTTGSGPTSARPRTRSPRASSRTWSATPRPT